MHWATWFSWPCSEHSAGLDGFQISLNSSVIHSMFCFLLSTNCLTTVLLLAEKPWEKCILFSWKPQVLNWLLQLRKKPPAYSISRHPFPDMVTGCRHPQGLLCSTDLSGYAIFTKMLCCYIHFGLFKAWDVSLKWKQLFWFGQTVTFLSAKLETCIYKKHRVTKYNSKGFSRC